MQMIDDNNDNEMVCRELASHKEDIQDIDQALDGIKNDREIFIEDIPSEST